MPAKPLKVALSDPVLRARQKKAETAARARAVDEWRRMGFTHAEGAWKSADKPMAAILPDLLGKLRLEQRMDESRILQIWPKIIDPQIVVHATPAGFAKGTLFVTVDSNVWLDEIVRYRRKEIIERLQTALGKSVVQKISFRLG